MYMRWNGFISVMYYAFRATTTNAALYFYNVRPMIYIIVFAQELTLNSTKADFKVRLLHVSVSSERLSAHIVAESDTMATFTSSARNKASAFSSKKNTDAS
jgi:predicted RNA-binding protein with PUA-like domain